VTREVAFNRIQDRDDHNRQEYFKQWTGFFGRWLRNTKYYEKKKANKQQTAAQSGDQQHFDDLFTTPTTSGKGPFQINPADCNSYLFLLLLIFMTISDRIDTCCCTPTNYNTNSRWTWKPWIYQQQKKSWTRY
jgi:hypothetical protein